MSNALHPCPKCMGQGCQGETKIWDITRDKFDSLEDVRVLEVTNLSLDELEMEIVVFTNDGGDGKAMKTKTWWMLRTS